ncbi:MAG: ATP-dependent Clp protease proteolytic subunit, partial [Prevotella sp.]|nr:ATP-dependent Clp protease proteolytic subunit [Prevotella sp.]
VVLSFLTHIYICIFAVSTIIQGFSFILQMVQYHLHLKGYVGGSDFNANDVTATLRSYPDSEVSVLIDSTGGLLSTALSISSAFRSHGNVHAHFVGMNASAATIASLGAKRITMDSSALYLVHKCSVTVFEWASMNSDQLQDYIKSLAKRKSDMDKFDDSVSAMYAARCRKPKEDLLALMQAGGWLTAKEALEWGFVDELTDFAEDSKPEMTEALAHAMVEAHMPLPAVPYAEGNEAHAQEPFFTRFITAMSALLKGHQEPKSQVNTQEPGGKEQSKTQDTMKNYTHIEATLKVEGGFKANTEGQVTLTEEQMDSLESAMTTAEEDATTLQTQVTNLQSQVTTLNTKKTELEGQVNALQEQVNALKGTPAAGSQQIVATPQQGGGQAKSPGEEYLDHLNSAQELYDMVSR